MKYVVFIGLALIEQVLMMIITKEIIHLQYEYISIKYATFKFADKQEKFCGLNILIKICFPIIYIILLSGIFYNFNNKELVENIYVITLFYYIIRWFNIIFILNRRKLHDWKSEFIIFAIEIVLNIFLYYNFIIKTTQIFISFEQLKDGIWIGIITFFFIIIRDYIYNHAHTNAIELEKRKEEYILSKYEHYKNKYGDIIDDNNQEIEAITYAIMIYENYNRPAFYRIFEYIKCIIKGRATLGVMQVESRVLISNRKSVEKGYQIIREAYEKNINEKEYMKKIISTYNLGGSYSEEVLYIIEVIQNEIESKSIRF